MEWDDREKHVYLAKLAEQAESYDDMVEPMKKVARMDVELTLMERSLLSVGYKNNIGTKRTLMRTLLSIEQEEETRSNCHYVKIVKDYRHRVEKDLSKICNDILSIVAIHLQWRVDLLLLQNGVKP
ncbi:14-3-3-like protein GF14 epsilon [Acorus calamus]|uniref:14-3-3-like protein GF14 epsilon n=1 Tax=Acorus calamus TaxID=4465 RepID=A0AAV9E400_ACOCL|nr:14-3-3-like protein GF14 epsilon [Acorus calamus]